MRLPGFLQVIFIVAAWWWYWLLDKLGLGGNPNDKDENP